MSQKGLLTVWNDAKGFGFITPEGGGERVFAHISSYAGRGRPASILAACSPRSERFAAACLVDDA